MCGESRRLGGFPESDYHLSVIHGFAKSPAYVSGSIYAQMRRFLESLAIDVGTLAMASALDPETLGDPDAHIPIELYLAIEAEAERATGDALFGLHMGEHAVSGSWSILGSMMMNCETLAEAFEKSARYCRIIGDPVKGRSYRSGGLIHLTLESCSPFLRLSRHSYECALSSLVAMMRDLTGADIGPTEVGIPGPEPTESAEYRRVFRCPVRFGSTGYRMIIDPAIGAVRLRYPNPGLLAKLEEYAADLLSAPEAEDRVAREVTRRIASRLSDGGLSIGIVARDMAMSVRTLQGRLAGEGRRFVDLVAETRLDFAKRYLRQGHTVDEITCLLGFAEPSVFRKAFKKWTGMTPGEFRMTPRKRVVEID